MKTKTQHTPTPWKIVSLAKNQFYKEGSEGTIGFCAKEEDANFIVRAVNSHEDMLDVIKRAKRVVAESCGYNDGVRFHTDLLRDIESAIAQAEGK